MKQSDDETKRLTIRIRNELWNRLLKVPLGISRGGYTKNGLINRLIEEGLEKLGY